MCKLHNTISKGFGSSSTVSVSSMVVPDSPASGTSTVSNTLSAPRFAMLSATSVRASTRFVPEEIETIGPVRIRRTGDLPPSFNFCRRNIVLNVNFYRGAYPNNGHTIFRSRFQRTTWVGILPRLNRVIPLFSSVSGRKRPVFVNEPRVDRRVPPARSKSVSLDESPCEWQHVLDVCRRVRVGICLLNEFRKPPNVISDECCTE